MNPGEEESEFRRVPTTQRGRDQELDRWRGQITQQVRTLEKSFESISDELSAIRKSQETTREQAVAARTQLDETRKDLGAAVKEFKKARDEDVAQLRRVITDNKNLMAGLIGTLIVGIIVGLLVFVLTGGSHHP